MSRPIFHHDDEIHASDTCEPLAAAARRGDLRFHALARGDYPGEPLPEDAVPQVSSIGCWDAEKPQQWGLLEHRNEGIELAYLESGSLDFHIAGEWHPLQRGDFTVTRPWQAHCLGRPRIGASRLHWIILDVGVRHPHQPWSWPSWLALTPRDLEELTAMLRQNEQPVWHATEEVGRCFRDISALLERRPPTLGSRLAVLISELLICLLETLRQRGVKREDELISSERSVRLFLAKLPQQLHSMWTLDNMAQAAGLQRSQFASYCKRLTNQTPLQHLTWLRVERAKTILGDEPELSLAAISERCGFSGVRYFSSVFQRETGLSPGAWRLKPQEPG